jgi:ABC-type transport system involved in multi-copper enzyme maturation permease subunit
MSSAVAHLMRKDLGEHRAWFAAFVGLVALRAALVGSRIDASVNDQNLLLSLSLASFLLTILHGALLVALAVQLVQGDRLVGTTAFWLTRPVRRVDLVLAKLGTAVAAFVAVPMILDALVMVVSGLAWAEVPAAMAEGAMMRLAIALPVMALASVTSDLAGFVVSAVAALFATLAVEAAVQWLRLVPSRSMASAYSATVVVAGVLIVGASAAFAHQGFTRRRGRTVGVMCAVGLLGLFAANWWTVDFVSPREGLEPGWLDPSRVTMTMTPVEAALGRGTPDSQQWRIRATYAFAGAPPSVVLTPISLNAAAVLADGTREALVVSSGSDALLWELLRVVGPALHNNEPVEALLGGVRVLNAREVSDVERLQTPERFQTLAWLGDDRYRQYVDGRLRLEIDATLGTVGCRVGAVLPLDGAATGTSRNRRFSLLSANCQSGRCTVIVRDVMPASLIELGRRSRMVFVLVNKTRGRALLNGEQGYLSRVPVFGSAQILTEHVLVTHHRLVFEAPKDMPDAIDAGWQQEAAIAAIEMRDIGTFRVRTVVGSRR